MGFLRDARLVKPRLGEVDASGLGGHIRGHTRACPEWVFSWRCNETSRGVQWTGAEKGDPLAGGWLRREGKAKWLVTNVEGTNRG